MTRGRAFLFLGFTLVSTAILFGLAGWQWIRRGEKAELITSITAALDQPPRALAGAELYTRVAVEGQFLHDKTVLIHTSRPAPKPGERDSQGRIPISGFGAMVVTAFQPICAPPCALPVLLVNRGFVPMTPRGEVQPYDKPDGVVRLTGILRPSERASLFPPYNAPERGIYFTRNTPQIALALKLEGAVHAEAASYIYDRFLDIEGQNGATQPPYGLEAAAFVKAIPNNHAQYAFTWASLALVNLVIAGLILLCRRKDAAKG